jgi:hypothetical protein
MKPRRESDIRLIEQTIILTHLPGGNGSLALGSEVLS